MPARSMLIRLAPLGLLLALFAGGARAQEPVEVDVELALLVDVSRSMTQREVDIQRRGYAEALTSEPVLAAIERGYVGRIALAYIEWAGPAAQRVVVDWTLILGRGEAEAVAERLLEGAGPTLRRTSISGAIDYAARSIETNGFEGWRTVIDVSGDGPNNEGRPVTEARDDAVAKGHVVNGLPLMTQEGMGALWRLEDLDAYYRDCVIGGPGAFAIPVLDWTEFAAAVRRKLVLDLVGLPPEVRLFRAATDEPYDCLVGEKRWGRFRGGWGGP